jgi:riboflavin kinase/FMN adenylyltransferase
MKIFQGIEDWQQVKNPIVTTGSYDGVHLAHRSIISLLNHHAEIAHGESVLVTFYPHPRLVLKCEDGFREKFMLITTEKEKMKALEDTGLQNVLVIPFTKEFSAMSSENFIKKILVDTVHVKKMIVGFNHSFGCGRGGNYDSMLSMGEQYDFSVDKYPEYVVHNRKISSTHIRELIISGHISEANELLGYNFMIIGTYEDGRLKIDDPCKIIPAKGQYLTRVTAGGLRHYAVCEVCENGLFFPDLSFIPTGVDATAWFIKTLGSFVCVWSRFM